MSHFTSCVPAKPNHNEIPIPIPATKFHPRVWEAQELLSFTSPVLNDNITYEIRHSELRKEVEKLLLATNDGFKELDIVDKIQQLGVGYHFKNHIEDSLQRSFNNQNFDNDDRANLYYVSLRFRLLRQAGFYISPDVFNKYKDENGLFHTNLSLDVHGLLSLYEASFLGIAGEDVLDDALEFTCKHLRCLVTHLSPPLASQVQRSLYIPLHHGMQRIHARYYISIYGDDKNRIDTLLEFAKLDFNIVQSIHQGELFELVRCWEKINSECEGKVTFQIRDRMAEAYVICMGMNSDPTFSMGRIHLTKVWYEYSIIDDAYETYEDIEELKPLHDAIQRWDDNDIKLKYHERVILRQLNSLLKEIEGDMYEKRNFIGMPYLKKALQRYSQSSFDQAKVMTLGKLAPFKKWFPISTYTAQFDAFLVAAMMNMGEHGTKEIFDWIDSVPDIPLDLARLCRLIDDIADFKVERDSISNVTCYMNDYGVTEKEAIRDLQKMVKMIRKDINKALLKPTLVPRPILHIILSIARTISENFTEDGGDGYTMATGRTKEIITMLLRDPIHI